MTPSPIIFQLVGKSKKVPERRNEPKGAFAKREKIRYLFNFEGMFLACAKRHYYRFIAP